MSPLLITGFHRSGTSAVARAFHRAGLDLGDDLLGATPGNPHGHFEDRTAVAMHDALLDDAGLTWKSVTAVPRPIDAGRRNTLQAFVSERTHSGKLWGIKDPRLCLLLDEWTTAAPMAKVIVIIRRPGESIRSLHMRHSRRHVVTRGVDSSDLEFWRTPDLGVALWVHYHRELLASLPSTENIHVVNFADRASIDQLVPTVSKRWGLDLDTSQIPRLDPRLGHDHVDPIDVRDPSLLTEATELWSEFLRLVART